MIEDTKKFINNWVSENVNAEAYAAPGDKSRARQLAKQCEDDAKAIGISRRKLNEAVKDMVGGADDLVTFFAEAMESATNAEVERLSEKDG